MKKSNVAYLRVSTEAQTEKYGLDMQKQKILDYCEKEGVTIDKWYVDGGYSGSKLDRPKIQELLDDAKNGMIANVYIYKLDRMSRDVIDTLTLLYRVLPEYGVKIISMTEDLRFENPMDKVMVGVNAIMGQYEREVIYMRTRAGMVERVKKGLWMGGGRIPYGYYYDRNDGILHVKEDEAEIVRNVYRMYLDGYSCDKIAKILGLKWESLVLHILTRKANIGYIEYKGKVYQGRHEPIIDKETFYEAQECMKRRHTNSHVANDHMLTGLCYCGVCGARMRYQKWGKYHKLVCYSQYRSGKEYMRKDPNCDNPRAFADDVESEVEDCFKRFSVHLKESEEKESTEGIIRASIKKKKGKIKNLYKLYAENPTENLFEVIHEEEKELEELERELEKENGIEKKRELKKLEEIKHMGDIWGDLSNEEKNRILKKCVEKVVITGSNIEIRFSIFQGGSLLS